MLGLEDLCSGRARKQAKDAAPVFEIPPRPVIAIEHPCVIKNLDKGIKSLGPNPDFQQLFNGEVPRPMLPLWLRPDALMSKPIMSHAAASNNVLLKITVPKRTGRKRKRGSNEPFSGDLDLGEAEQDRSSSSQVCSAGRQDKPASLLRKLRDNVGNYEAEAVGSIKETHRYRGLADFQFAVEGFPTVQNIAEHLMPMQVSKLRDFKFDTSLDTRLGQEILPPPHFTDKVVPFNYFYDQNPFVRAEGLDENGKPIIVNINRKRANYGHYIPYDQFPVPEAPLQPMAPHLEQISKELLSKVEKALDERPIWTRRALINRVGPVTADTHMKIAIATYGYQFKGGPWRDAVIKYGIDPRSDAKYRHFQTLAFKLHKLPKLSKISNGHAKALTDKELSSSHIWDGESYCTNGKFWQICDITDPVLTEMIEKAPLLTECDINDGGFWPVGFWAKVKAFMKAKMIAIRAGRYGRETDGPKRRGLFYTSDLVAKLNEYPDVLGPNGRSALTVHSLLYGLEDVSGLEGLRYRHRPLSQYSNPYAALGFGEGGQRKRSKTKGRLAHGAPADADEGDKEPGPARGPDFPDDAWAHILDSDLSGSGEDDGDGDGDDADETTMLSSGRGLSGPAMGNDSDDEM